jgi:fatty acid desaturase
MNDFRSELRALRRAPYRGVPRIGVDLAVWALAAWLCPRGVAWHLAVAFLIGAVPMHDLLLQGHEGNHRMLSRMRVVNEVLTWFTHAIIGLSHTAHRAFHLEHHRHAHTQRDPEVVFLDSLIAGVPGWAYLLIPTRVHWAVNTWPLSNRTREASALTVGRDLAATGVLHLLALVALGASSYIWFVLVPAATGFPLAFGIRSICEHHYTTAGSRWTSSRHVQTSHLIELVWSNVNYHLEHHLFPTVPFHQLPAVRRLLARHYAQELGSSDTGYLHTAWRLVREPIHSRPKVEPVKRALPG